MSLLDVFSNIPGFDLFTGSVPPLTDILNTAVSAPVEFSFDFGDAGTFGLLQAIQILVGLTALLLTGNLLLGFGSGVLSGNVLYGQVRPLVIDAVPESFRGLAEQILGS